MIFEITDREIYVSYHEWLSDTELEYAKSCIAKFVECEWGTDNSITTHNALDITSDGSMDDYMKKARPMMADSDAVIIVPFNGIISMEQYHEFLIAQKGLMNLYVLVGNRLVRVDDNDDYLLKIIYEGLRTEYAVLQVYYGDWY